MDIERFHNELAMRLGYERIVNDKRILISVEESEEPLVTLKVNGSEVIRFKASEDPENLQNLNSKMHDEIKQISAAVHDAYLRSTNNSLFVYNSLQR